MTEYRFVRRPNYVQLGPNGEMQEMFCKVCGTAIGGLTEQVKGRRFEHGVWIEERVERFRRFHNYVELKIAFEDGSAHVTNGCNNCLSESLTPEQLNELHMADMELDGASYTAEYKKRIPTMVMAVRSDGGGLT